MIFPASASSGLSVRVGLAKLFRGGLKVRVKVMVVWARVDTLVPM